MIIAPGNIYAFTVDLWNKTHLEGNKIVDQSDVVGAAPEFVWLAYTHAKSSMAEKNVMDAGLTLLSALYLVMI